MYTQIHTHTYTYMYTHHTPTHMHTHAHSPTPPHTHPHTPTHTHFHAPGHLLCPLLSDGLGSPEGHIDLLGSLLLILSLLFLRVPAHTESGCGFIQYALTLYKTYEGDCEDITDYNGCLVPTIFCSRSRKSFIETSVQPGAYQHCEGASSNPGSHPAFRRLQHGKVLQAMKSWMRAWVRGYVKLTS